MLVSYRLSHNLLNFWNKLQAGFSTSGLDNYAALCNLPNLIKLTYQDWKEDKAWRLAATLACHTIFSLEPLLIIVIVLTELFWQKRSEREKNYSTGRLFLNFNSIR